MAPKTKTLDALGQTYLREYRIVAGYSLIAAARLLDLSPSQLSNIETFKSPYNQRLIEKASVLYRCAPADLLGRHPLQPPDLDMSALFQVIVLFEQSCIRNDRVTRATPFQKAEAIVILYRLLASGDKTMQDEAEIDNRLRAILEEAENG